MHIVRLNHIALFISCNTHQKLAFLVLFVACILCSLVLCNASQMPFRHSLNTQANTDNSLPQH
jgi:hypothetical protein